MSQARDDGLPRAPRKGLFARLRGDVRGNTLAMMAALLIPLLGMFGSGVDMARTYMAKAKLQTACDSAALAARRVMDASAFDDATAGAEGRRFFNFNFPNGTMQTTPVNLAIGASATDASVIAVSASTNVPTTIMAFFGSDQIPINVSCSADKDYVNNDIMLALDVTGSMNCAAGTGDSCSYQATEQANSRISRLRSAAGELYTALAGATGVRTRYGFMPFSMTVNVGQDVRDLNTAYILNPVTYWRRPSGSWVQSASVDHTIGTTSWFAARANSGFCLEERSSVGQTGSAVNTISISAAVVRNDIDLVSTTDNALKWRPYDDAATQGQTGSAGNLTNFCPKRARRLTPYATATEFNTALLNAVGRHTSHPQYSAAVDANAVGGYTNHDLGLMWSMRYLSGTGMFFADNPDTFDATPSDGINNSIPVERHIVFLTDGAMTATAGNYSAYGIPSARNVLTGAAGTSDAQLRAAHIARFQNACTVARTMATVWVIVLDVGDPSAVRPCATDASHFFVSNGSDLANIFQLIGRGIGRTRLVQ